MIIMSMNKGKLKSLLMADLKHILIFGKVLVPTNIFLTLFGMDIAYLFTLRLHLFIY